VSPLELVDDHFGKLAEELRASRPDASDELRTRVRALRPAPRRGFELDLSLRRLVPAVALGALAAALGVAGVLGIVHGSSGSGRTTAAKPAVPRALKGSRSEGQRAHLPAYSAYARKAAAPLALNPTTGRLQQYDAVLRVRVKSQDELSRRTQDALRLTRKLGGYVVTARYAAPGRSGQALLVLRIPIEHVQTAIARFSGYGFLVRQQIVLKDLQRRVDDLAARIGRLRAQIAHIERELAGNLTPERRAALEQRLQRDRNRIDRLRKARSSSVRRAQLARVSLTIVVGQKPAAAPAGRFRRTIDDAGSVLLRELELLVYALVVAGPLLAIGGAGLLAGRSVRRRADHRLLERS
jgi:hypothetical protein